MLLLLWISLFSMIFGGLIADTCERSEYKKCSEKVEFKDDYDFDVSKKEFKKTCEKKLKAAECVRDYERKCTTATPKIDGLNIDLSSKVKLDAVELLCAGDAEYRTDTYLHNACSEKMKSDFAYCDLKFEESQKEIHEDDLEPKMIAFHSCCAFNWVKGCKATSVQLRCDEVAKNPLSWISSGRELTEVCESVLSTPNTNCSGLHGTEVEDLVTKFSKSASLIPSYAIPLLCFVLLKIYAF